MARIKLAAFDVDGTLTDGTITYTGGGNWAQRFSMADGLGFRRLIEAGVEVAIITAKDFEGTKERMKMLGVKHAHYSISDKLATLTELCRELGIDLSEAAFMGDDLPDLEALEAAGTSATVPGAPTAVQKAAGMVTTAPAGHGAAREFAEKILELNQQS